MALRTQDDCLTREREKPCVSCEKVLPLTAFYTQRSSKDGRTSYCVICSRAAAARWRNENPERHAANQARARAKDPRKAKQAVYAAEWQAKHLDRHLEANRQYRDRMMLQPKPDETSMKICGECGAERPLSQFHVRRAASDGRQTKCMVCTNKKSRKYLYGLTPEHFEQMWRDQEGLCPLCRDLLVPTVRHGCVVDHDHATGEVRGLLCGRCNLAIGHFRDDPNICDRAASYLRTHAHGA